MNTEKQTNPSAEWITRREEVASSPSRSRDHREAAVLVEIPLAGGPVGSDVFCDCNGMQRRRELQAAPFPLIRKFYFGGLISLETTGWSAVSKEDSRLLDETDWCIMHEGAFVGE